MYPRVDESDTHAAAHGHPAYAMPAAIPNYGAPPPYVAPYTTNSMRTPMAIRTQRWSTSLCHCLDDPANCVVTCFCPCVTFGQIADILNRGSSSCTCEGAIYTLLAFLGVPCLYSCYYRSKLRAQYDLPEAPCMDCLVHFCCETCALCQEYRELRNRGFDLSIGWEANAERVQGVTVPPPVSSAMTR